MARYLSSTQSTQVRFLYAVLLASRANNHGSPSVYHSVRGTRLASAFLLANEMVGGESWCAYPQTHGPSFAHQRAGMAEWQTRQI